MLVKFNFLSQALMEQTNVTMILPSWTLFDSGKGKAESYVPGTKFQVLYLLHTDTSFKNAKVMRELAGLFGEDKLLFATDYPFDGITQSVAACEEAFADDPVLADKVFYGNAAKLLHL